MTRDELISMVGAGAQYEAAIDAILASIKPPFVAAALKTWRMQYTDSRQAAQDRMIARLCDAGEEATGP